MALALATFATFATFAARPATAQDLASPASPPGSGAISTATATEIHQGLEDAVSSEMQATAEAAVAETFKSLRLKAPVKVETATDADFDLTPVAPQLTDVSVRVRVYLIEESPAEELRKSRQALASKLRSKGWRVDGLGAAEAPDIKLVMEPVLVESFVSMPNEARPYLVLGALLLGALCALILAFWMVARSLRALTRPKRRAYRPGKRRDEAAATPRLLADENLTRTGDPDVGLISRTRAMLAEKDDGGTGPEGPADLGPSAAPTAPPEDFAAGLRRKISALPLDKAIEALAALDPRTRRHIIGTLDLKEPVRRRLERELVENPLPRP